MTEHGREVMRSIMRCPKVMKELRGRVTRKAYAEDSIELVCSAAKGGAMKPRFAFSGSDVLFLESVHVIFI
jgi:hypothetical protein